MVPTLPRGPATVGVRITVIVAVAAAFSVPTEQVTVDGEPVGAPQVPGELVAETKVAPDTGNTSVNVIPVVRSPLFVTVYLNVTWFPAPAGSGDTGVVVAAIDRLTFEPNLVANASLDPLSAPWNAAASG